MYGLRVKNNQSQNQIDSIYQNFEKTEEGFGFSVTNNNLDAPNYGETNLDIIDDTRYPIIPLRPNTDFFVELKDFVTSGFGHYYSVNLLTEYSQTTTIDWKCYRVNNSKSSENYGIRIKNSNGAIVFESGKTYLKIISVHIINLADPTFTNFPSEDITHASISNPFYVLAHSNEKTIQSAGVGRKVLSVGIKKINATSVRVGWYNRRNSTSAPIDSVRGVNNPITLLVTGNL